MMMSTTESWISGDHKTQLISDGIHASVVLVVVVATTVLALVSAGIPTDVIGSVFGSAVGYAAGRAGNVARTRGQGDAPPRIDQSPTP